MVESDESLQDIVDIGAFLTAFFSLYIKAFYNKEWQDEQDVHLMFNDTPTLACQLLEIVTPDNR